MTTPNDATLSHDATTISNLLWAAESLYEDIALPPGNKHQLHQHSAGLAIIRTALKMAAKLADDIEARVGI